MHYSVTHRNKQGVLTNAFDFNETQAVRWVKRYQKQKRIVLALYCGVTHSQWLVLHTNVLYNGTSLRIDGTLRELSAFILKYLRGVDINFSCMAYLAREVRSLIEDETPMPAAAIEQGMSIKFHLDYVPDDAIFPHAYTGDVFAVTETGVGMTLDGDMESRRTRWFYKHELLHVSMLNRKKAALI